MNNFNVQEQILPLSAAGNEFKGLAETVRGAFATNSTQEPLQIYLPVFVSFTNALVFTENRSITDALRLNAARAASSLPSELRRSVVELATLAPDWDGEGAAPIKSHVLADVVETLKRLIQRAGVFPPPYLVPTFDGFVQMEWHGQKRMLDIEAVEKGWEAVGTLIDSGNQPQYFTAEFERNDFEKIWTYYEWWTGNSLWPLL